MTCLTLSQNMRAYTIENKTKDVTTYNKNKYIPLHYSVKETMTHLQDSASG